MIFFSRLADFTPVCTAEYMTFASMADDFKGMNGELLGLSIDSNYSHIAWLRRIKEKIDFKGLKNVEVNFPVISDLTMKVAKKFGMLQPAASTTQAVRAVFIIDPEGKVRAILYYPLTAGRNMEEIKRLLTSLQRSEEHKVATPANWQGDDVIIPPPGSCRTARERVEGAGEDYYCLDSFLLPQKGPRQIDRRNRAGQACPARKTGRIL